MFNIDVGADISAPIIFLYENTIMKCVKYIDIWHDFVYNMVYEWIKERTRRHECEKSCKENRSIS